MPNQKQLTVRMNEDLYLRAQEKCKKQLGITMSTLIKVFLKSFVSQRGVGFYVGDDDLTRLFNNWMHKRQFENMRKGRVASLGPKLRDIFDL